MHHRRLFPIGKHATYYPEILKQVAAAGTTHRLAHLVAPPNLNNKKLTEQQKKTRSRKDLRR